LVLVRAGGLFPSGDGGGGGGGKLDHEPRAGTDLLKPLCELSFGGNINASA
jgi:hypothetical protein